jgi:hypothetical protein
VSKPILVVHNRKLIGNGSNDSAIEKPYYHDRPAGSWWETPLKKSVSMHTQHEIMHFIRFSRRLFHGSSCFVLERRAAFALPVVLITHAHVRDHPLCLTTNFYAEVHKFANVLLNESAGKTNLKCKDEITFCFSRPA